jgi:EmrB/QacA subfamily drug resistance transporter
MAVASGLLMEFVDTTALATALPSMAGYFGVRPESLKLALTAYVLALAVFMPASAWLADRLGAKRVYLGSLLVFSLGSVACAVSPGLSWLVAARILQGLGGALMTPVGRTIILRSVPRSELVPAMNWFTMPAQLGPLLGPPLAGLLLAVADWRWIFLINLPIAALGALAVARYVPGESSRESRDFDLRGYLLVATAIVLFVGTLAFASSTDGTGLLAAALLASLACGALFVRHALRHKHPVLDVRLLADSTFRNCMTGGTLARFAVGAGPLLLPLLLQLGLGWTPLQAGMVLMGQAIGTVLAKAVATTVLRRYTLRTVLIGSNLAAAALTATPALFGLLTPLWLVFMLLVATGLTRSLQFTVSNSVAYADLKGSELSVASTLASVIQQVGHAVGISIAGLLLALGTTGAGTLELTDFRMPFMAMGLLGATASLAYARLHARAGENMRGRPDPAQ